MSSYRFTIRYGTVGKFNANWSPVPPCRVGLKIELHEIHEIHQNLRNPVSTNRNPLPTTKSNSAKRKLPVNIEIQRNRRTGWSKKRNLRNPTQFTKSSVYINQIPPSATEATYMKRKLFKSYVSNHEINGFREIQ